MTDKEKFEKLMKEFGITDIYRGDYSQGGTSMEIYEGDNVENGDYGLYTRFTFDKDGKFVFMGAWSV